MLHETRWRNLCLAATFLLCAACVQDARLSPARPPVAPLAAEGDGKPAAPGDPIPIAPDTAETDHAADPAVMLQELQRSGPGDDAWSVAALGLFERWRAEASARQPLVVHFGAMQCFRAGCYLDAHYPDAAALDAMTRDFFQSAVFHELEGDVFRSPPRDERGPAATSVTATWIVAPL